MTGRSDVEDKTGEEQELAGLLVCFRPLVAGPARNAVVGLLTVGLFWSVCLCLHTHRQVLDSGVAQGSCFFRDSATTLGPDHGYLRDADGTLGTGDFQYDLSQRKVVQCECIFTFRCG